MNNYFTTLRADYKTNEVALGLAGVALVSAVVFGGMVLFTVASGNSANAFMNALTLPILFAAMSVIHFLARPAVLNYYAKS